MILFPAIDLYEGQAVRLIKGDYKQKTVYSNNPLAVALHFKDCGAGHLHIVDLEGARSGYTPNFDLIVQIKKESGLFVEAGGGIRNSDTIKKYLDAGIDRVILGTAAVKNISLVETAVKYYNKKIAVGIDMKDGFVAINGWLEKSLWRAEAFLEQMRSIGIQTIICTDISRDGMMMGRIAGYIRRLPQPIRTSI